MNEKDAIENLIDKAKNADSADDALKFSQAALNVANATAKRQEEQP